MSKFLTRLKRALVMLRCSGDPIFVYGTGTTDGLQSTRGGCVEAPHSLPSIGWRFCHGLHHCDRCPRFEAYRQGLAAREGGNRNLGMPIGSEQIHAEDVAAMEVANVSQQRAIHYMGLLREVAA